MKKSKNKKRLFISFLIPILIVAVPLLFFIDGCKSDYSSVTFAIEKNGLTYLYSPNEFLVKNAIKEDEVPMGLNINIIYVLDGLIYMRPNDLQQVTNILSENYRIIEKKEPSYDGYAVSDSSSVYNATVQNKASIKIGETESTNIVTLTSKSNRSKSMEIKWRTLPELKALENCSLEGVWKSTNPYPGKTVTNWEDEILVKLNDLNSFYGNSFELILDEESSVLYFKEVNNK
jgi:hypothetical protein